MIRWPLLAALAVAALCLSGCYVSNRLLLNPDEAVHPLDDGLYVRDGDPDDKFRLQLRPDGWYDVEDFDPNGMIGATHKVLVTKADLAGEEGFAIAELNDDGGYTYAVGFIRDGRVFLATPDCADSADRDDAVDHGGEPQDDEAMTHNCLFKSRDAVLSALSAFAGHAIFGDPYQRH